MRLESVKKRESAKEKIVGCLVQMINSYEIKDYQDEPIFNLFERWNRFYKNYIPESIELANFLFTRVLQTVPSFRQKVLVLFYKTYRMMVTQIEDSGMDTDSASPFLSLSPSIRDQDQVYKSMQENKEKFAKDYIELIMKD